MKRLDFKEKAYFSQSGVSGTFPDPKIQWNYSEKQWRSLLRPLKCRGFLRKL